MRAATSLSWLTVSIVAIGGLTPTLEGGVQPTQRSSPPISETRVMPAAGSALAASNDAVFAIAADGRHILTRPVDLSGPWRVLPVEGQFSRLRGLAINGRGLVASDGGDEAVYHIDLSTGRRTTLFEEGPLRNPGSLAVARDVFVADELTFKLYRIRNGQVREIALEKDKNVGKDKPLSLAAYGDDLFVSSPDGLISEFRGLGRADPAQSQSPQQTSGAIYREKRSLEPLVFTLQKRAFPDIDQPSDIAIWKGVVYVVDSKLQSVFAFSRHDQRPVRLARGPVTKPVIPSSLAVNDTALYILHGNELQRWPRLIPAEVHLRLASVSESMSRVYEYLRERDILPVRKVTFEQNIEYTLKKNRVILAGYTATLDRLLCQLNPGVCDTAGKIKLLRPGIDIWVPDLYSENYVDAIPVTLRGDESLGQVADRRVTSPEFADWKSEPRLKELNESQLARAKVESAREVRVGEYMTPVEYVRYLVPAVAGEASGTGALKRLETVFEGLRVISLEERPPSSASARRLTTLQDPDLGTLKAQFTAMLGTIDYFAPGAAPSLAKVGVAEEFIDTAHPDLQNALMAQDGIQPVPAGVPPAAGVKYQIRSFQKSDHGTMVAGLIGARASGFDHGGLAPKAMLLPLRNVEPAIGEDIRRARLRGVFIFNISAHYDLNVIPQSLRAAIDQYQDSLFIVAAGNDLLPGVTNEVCRDFLVFPACWHDKKNVLVVTATTAAGDMVLPAGTDLKGANWSGSAVHLAAPGIGYHAPAIGSSYAPVQGSSFATPLVTASAALLFAQSVARPDPLSIKQRLIATSDPEPGFAGKLLGGRLNVRRALSNLGFGVLTRQIRQPDNTSKTETERIVLEDGRITVRQPDGNDLLLQVRQLRRVHQYGNAYRIVYVDHRNQLDVLPNVTFTTEQDAQFRATTEAGAVITVNLLEWADFVAPF